MNSIKVSPEETETMQSSSSAEPPGSWFQRRLYKTGFMLYGMFLMNWKMMAPPFEKMCTKNTSYDPEDETRRPGEVVVITGGPRGIAYELTKKFLQLDFIVIMGCRDVSSSQKKVDEMRADGILSGTVHFLPLNLKSLAATKEFAEGVLKITNRIDLLMNNAGVMMTPYECTVDGLEAQFQVNYLSHFLLSLLLLPTMKRTAEERDDGTCCRIVNTSSSYHHAGNLDIDDLERKKVYSPPKCYFDSKMCQILFSKQLDKRLKEERAKVNVYAVHPGVIPSELWINAGAVHKVFAGMMKPVMLTVEDGANALLHAALSSTLENKGGSYLEGLKIAKPHSQANDEHLQELLWSRSEILCQGFL